MTEGVTTPSREYIEHGNASFCCTDVDTSDTGSTLQEPLYVHVIGQRAYAVDLNSRAGFSLRERSALRRCHVVYSTIDPRAQRAAPAFAREVRVQSPPIL